MSTKGPVISLDMKKAQLQRTNDALANFLATAQPSFDSLKSVFDVCQTNLASLRTVTNQRLNAALGARNNVNLEQSKIAQINANLDATISSLKSGTAAMKTLAASLKQSFG